MTESETRSQRIERAFFRVLRPAIRLAVRNGVTFPALSTILKRLYVEEASKEISSSNSKVTVSAVSVTSGIHRKDVKRLLEQPDEAPSDKSTIPLSASVIAVWTGKRKYLEKSGEPKVLPRRGRRKNEASFESLAQEVSSDVQSKSILEELIRQEIVTVDEDSVELNSDAFVPTKSFDEKVGFFELNGEAHLSTFAHNLVDANSPMLERSVFYYELPKGVIDQVRVAAEKHGMEALQKVNRKAQELEKKATNDGPNGKMVLGVYFYTDTVDK